MNRLTAMIKDVVKQKMNKRRRRMNMNRKLTAMAMAMMVVLAGFAAQAAAQIVPTLINYQGKLTDSSGALPTADYKLEFNIYDAASDGNLIWGPQTMPVVPVVQGYFNVMLGPKDSSEKFITTAFTGGTDRYLEIKANDTVILPRQQILSAPYAIKAMEAAQLKDGEFRLFRNPDDGNIQMDVPPNTFGDRILHLPGAKIWITGPGVGDGPGTGANKGYVDSKIAELRAYADQIKYTAENAWPPGNYCVWQKGPCPSGFQESAIEKWDSNTVTPMGCTQNSRKDGNYLYLRMCCKECQ